MAHVFVICRAGCYLENKKQACFSKIVVSGFFILLSSAIIMSFSRSFWLASALVFFAFSLALLLLRLQRIKQLTLFIAMIIIFVGISYAIAMSVPAIPFPKGSSSAELLKKRVLKFKGESALSSRYSQIKPLLSAISDHPLIGSGLGAEVTYKSQDPTVLKNHPDGIYKTYAFELGWLEIWLKTGLLGLLIYSYLLLKIFILGIKSAKTEKNFFLIGTMFGLMAVIVTHFASPYLNHPLGIGIIMLSGALVDSRIK